MAADVFLVKVNGNSSIGEIAEAAGRLADRVGLSDIVNPGHFYMVKVHFGERGNNTYVNPECVAPLVERLKDIGARAFVSDTNTLYVGNRSNAVDHLTLAAEHGFTLEKVGAPVLIADGLLGENQSNVEVNLKHYRQVSIANDARAADGFLVVTNVTGHVLTGLAGSIKNVGMGLAGRGGKRSQHCDMSPEVIRDKCIACGTCVKWCPTQAISVGDVASIDAAKCIGCGECYAVCPSGAVRFEWSETSANLQEKLVEHCVGALKAKRGASVFFNFMTAVTLNCNCMGKTEDTEIAPLGILASTDIVAVDQASADLAKEAAGEDLFKRMYSSWDYTVQLAYGEKVGLGTREYNLKTVS